MGKIQRIQKRDGEIVRFDKSKITNAIFAAAKAVGAENKKKCEKLASVVTERLEEQFEGKQKLPDVETIQNLVENVLMEKANPETAKAYIRYRQQHEQIREIGMFIEDVTAVEDYINKDDWEVKENANMSYSLQGLNNYLSEKMIKKYWLKKMYPKHVQQAHEEGIFHIHDLGVLGPYCVGWDLKDFLSSGFEGVRGKIETTAPKHFGAALGQLVNLLYTLQGEAAGAQAVSNVDTLLAPFIAYDNLSRKQVEQEMQSWLFNMNVPTRVGFQTPFTNITLDLKVPEHMKNEPVLIGGELKDRTYGEFQEQVDLFNEVFAKLMMEGDAKGRPFTFPIPTYNISNDFDWDNGKLDPIWEMTSKYGIPYFANFINSDMDPEDARSMCPIDGEEKVLIRSSRGRGLEHSKIRNIYEGNSNQEEYEVFSDGKFVKGRFNKFKDQKMMQVTLDNEHTIKITEEHLNFVLKDKNSEIEVLKGKELSEGMYIPYSLKRYPGKTGGKEDMGFFVGAFAGDGSFDGNTTVTFSLSKEQKKNLAKKLINIAEENFGAHSRLIPHEETGLLTLKIHSKAAVGLCKDYVSGTGREKRYRARLFDTSIAFREGVIEGHYATDGGNRNRIYTSSEKMVESLNMLAATLGTTTSIYKDDREGRFGKEPNYAVLIYQLNRESYGELWFKKKDKLWIKIKTIEDISNDTAYCFEAKNAEPMFTVGSTGILTHNCRLRLDKRELKKRGGGLFGADPQTGSIGVVTINLPRIGYEAKNEEQFMELLDERMDMAKKSLEIKREVLEGLTERGLFPYSQYYLRKVKEAFGKYWKNHFSTIGINGMNDALLNFMDTDIGTEEGIKFTEKVLTHMRDRLADYQEETGDIFNLEATPAEGTSYRLARMDQKKYPDLRIYNQEVYGSQTPYYTNSTQLPVKYTDDLFQALDKQDPLQTKYTGGTVFHGFLGEKMPSEEATKRLVKKIAENYSLPYYTLTPTFSICPKHGYMPGEHRYCPTCDKELIKKMNKKGE